ncbi:hypothetical protein D3C83_55460 [compost metagenome]
MSALPLRMSTHATIAPPAPSVVIMGLFWLYCVTHTPTPDAFHISVPLPLIRCAKMS